MDRRVLVDRDHSTSFGADDPEQPVRPVVPGEDALLHLWREACRVGQYPDLDEAHGLVL